MFTDSTCHYNSGGIASVSVSMDDTTNVRVGMSVIGDHIGDNNTVKSIVNGTHFNLTNLPSESTAVVDGELKFSTLVEKFEPLCDGIDV